MPNRRKPNSIKVLEGTDRKDRMYDEPEMPPAESLDPPDYLINPEAVRVWTKITDILAPLNVLSEGDLEMLAQYCNTHAKCVQLWRAGETPTASLLTQLRLMATEFGLTPASRSKAGQIEGGGDVNPFAEIESKTG